MTKITLIGAGSYSWGPIFLRDLIVTPELAGSEICLHDIDAERLALNYRLAQKFIDTAQADFRLTQTLSLVQAVQCADFIILTITTGGLESMRSDLEIPACYGIHQTVGDTTGPGGLSRALRNVPVLAAIAEKVNESCPKAWLLNYTNPMTTSTRTLDMFRSVQYQTIGLCHEWIGVRARLAKYFDTQPQQIDARIAGINHLPWALDLQVSGRDAWDDLGKLAEMILTGQFDFDPDDDTPFADHGKVKAALFKVFGALPVAGDRHVAEFFGNFINPDIDFEAQYGLALTSVEYRAQEMAYARGLIESALSGELPVVSFLQEHSNEAASEIMSAMVTGGRYIGIMNLPNAGQITNLPREAVVETYGVIEPAGARGMAVGNVPAGVRIVLERHIANQEITIKAALAGDRNLALQVLVNDPLTRGMEIRKCQEMLAELLEANRAYLPLFF